VKQGDRVLVTTLTKRMAEELTKYLTRYGVRCRYIHSDVDTLERVEIMRDLRLGLFDVLIGVNLLREGLDLPEVSLVAILDADKEGFLRSERSLVQTVGRAARHLNGKAIMYADKITDSMQRTIDETNRRREKQAEYNRLNNTVPRALNKAIDHNLPGSKAPKTYGNNEVDKKSMAAEEAEVRYQSPEALQKLVNKTRKEMETAAKSLDFIEAARLRDTLIAYEEKLKEMKV